MIILCDGPWSKQCELRETKIYDRNGSPEYCVQLNYGTNVTEFQTKEGLTYGYRLTLYKHENACLILAITNNSARVILEELRENVFPGQETSLVLSKTVQTSLGPPYSNCNQSTDYRQVNCIEDCDKKAIKEACSCGYDTECPWLDKLSENCKDAFKIRSGIESKCNQECPVECNQVSFQSKRSDVELEIDNSYYKPSIKDLRLLIEQKFNIPEYTEYSEYRDKNEYDEFVGVKFNTSKFSDEEIKKRITMLSIYFDKFETTEITQSPSITPTSLIANVGGLLGK